MNFTNFLGSLPIMASGMIGIFIVTGIIIGTIYILNKVSSYEKKDDEE